MRAPWLVLAGTIVLGSALVFQSCRKEAVSPVEADATLSDDSEELMATPSESPFIEGQYIVVLKKGLRKVDARQSVLAVAAAYGIKPDHVYTASLSGFAGKIPAGRLEALRQDSRVEYIEQDRKVSLPPYRMEKGPQPPSGQSTPWGVARVNGAGSYSGSGVAWIIDTGIDTDHPDLNVDASKGWNFISGTSQADDDNGHGTHVSGIIAARNNGFGVIGVAPGATVIPVKVLDASGSGSYTQVLDGVEFVAKHGTSGDVANMSLGGPPSEALDDAVIAASATVKFCIAAGNSRDNALNYSPARASGDNIYTISAFGSKNDAFASWSNYGNPPIEYSEPGVNIYSTYKGGTYATMSGTSMAAPHAAGIFLLGDIRDGGRVTRDPDRNADVIGVH